VSQNNILLATVNVPEYYIPDCVAMYPNKLKTFNVVYRNNYNITSSANCSYFSIIVQFRLILGQKKHFLINTMAVVNSF